MKMRKTRILMISVIALLLLLPAVMLPVLGAGTSSGIEIYKNATFDDLALGLQGHGGLNSVFAGNTASDKLPSSATVVADPDAAYDGDRAIKVSLEPAATGTTTAQDFVLFNNRVCYITWNTDVTTNSLGQVVYKGYFTDKGSNGNYNDRYGIQSTDNKQTALVIDVSTANTLISTSYAITSNTITYSNTSCTITWDGAATTDLFGATAYFGYFSYNNVAFRVKSTDGKASCVIIPKNTTYSVSNDAAVVEAVKGGDNVYRNLILAHDAVSYADAGKVVLQADYYIASGSKGTIWVQQQALKYNGGASNGGWVSYYTIDTAAGELITQNYRSSESKTNLRIPLEKDQWVTISVALDLVTGSMDIYVNNILQTSGSLYKDSVVLYNIVLNKNTWQLAKVNVNQGYVDNLRGEIYIDNATIHQYDDSQKVVFGESTNAAGDPAIAVAMELASGRDYGATLTDTVLVNANMTATPLYLTSDLTDGLIAPLNAASIRLTSAGGIRFGTQVNSEKMNVLQQMKESGQIADLQIGTLITPASYVTEAGGFTKEDLGGLKYAAKYLDVKATVGAYFSTKDAPMEAGYDQLFVGSILNIRPANLTREFAGIGYVKITALNGTEYYFYSYEHDPAASEVRCAYNISEVAQNFVNNNDYEKYWDVLQGFIDGLTVMSDISGSPIQNVQYTVNNFFFQNSAGVAMRLSYEGVSGWRFQAVQPTNTTSASKAYNNFNNTGAGQSLALYMGEYCSDETKPLEVTAYNGYIRVREKETGSYVDISTTGAFNVQFYAPDGEAMNNINGVSVSEVDGLPQITLTGALYDASREAIFGGGQRFDSANKRGLSLSLFTYDSYNGDNGRGTYTAIPLFMSTRGSGLFINRYERIVADFDVKVENQWTIELTNDLMDCYIYATGDMTDALNGYANISGYAAMPAEWAQGIMVCRYNPDFGTLDGTAIYEKLSDIPGYEDIHIGSSSGQLAIYATSITKGTYLYKNGSRAYYYDGTYFYGLTKKGNPGGYGVRQIVENLMDVGMKPNVVIIEALDYAWLNCTSENTTAKQNLQKIKEIADWLHENDIKLMLYMGVGQMSANLAGVKDEYYVRADITIEIDETVTVSHSYTDGYTANTQLIPYASISNNPDSLGTSTQTYLDITNPEAVDWYMNYIWGTLIDIGVDGCKLDFCEQMPNRVTPLKVLSNGEYVQVGTATVDYKWYDPTIFGDNDVHHAYSTYFTALFYRCMNQQMAEKNLNKTFHINTRGGGIGIQRNAYMWGGDQTRNETNLSTQILTMLNSGVSGMPFCSYDMGGYAYDTGTGGYFAGSLGTTADEVNNTESRIYLRAIQFTTFTTMIQTHGDVRNVYEMKLTGYEDGYVQKVNEQYLELHESLQSYIRKWSEVSCETGMPLVRHLGLQYQDDANTWDIDDQFMLGDGIMVAPILEIYADNREVYLPQGQWRDMLTGEIITVGASGKTITVSADMDQVPVFLNMLSEDYADLLEVFNSSAWQSINRGHSFESVGDGDPFGKDDFGPAIHS